MAEQIHDSSSGNEAVVDQSSQTESSFTSTPPSSNPHISTEVNIPQGDPLSDFRDIFSEDPALLKTMMGHFGNEHTLGQTLKDAHAFANSALTQTEKQAISRLGLGNDPIFLSALGRLNKEHTQMRQTIDQLTQENRRLQAIAAGKPVMHIATSENSMILGHGLDLHAEESRLAQAIKNSGTDLDARRRYQAQLTAIQETLYDNKKKQTLR